MKTQLNVKYRVISFGLAALAGSGMALSMSGCAQKATAQSLRSGNLRVTVKDLVSDSSMRVKQITIEKEGPGELQVNADIKHNGFEINAPFSPRQGQSTSVAELVFVADIVPSANPGATILHLANQVTTSNGVFNGSYGGQISSTPTSADNWLSAIKPGLYPVGVPLELGPVCGKSITLTVTEGN